MLNDIKKRLNEAQQAWNAHGRPGVCPYGCKGGSLAPVQGCATGAALENAVEVLRGQLRDELNKLGR